VLARGPLSSLRVANLAMSVKAVLRELSCERLAGSVVKFIRAAPLADAVQGLMARAEGQNYGVISKATPP